MKSFIVMLAGMRDLIPHDMLGHFDAEYKREPLDMKSWNSPSNAGVYHKRGGPFDSMFYDYLTQ